MSRQPRFIEDDEPRKRGNNTAHYSGYSAPKAAPKRSAEDQLLDDEVNRILAEEEAALFGDSQKEAPAKADEDMEKTRTFTARPTGPEEAADDPYDAPRRGGDDDYPAKSSGKKVALIIVALLLGFTILGASIYALVHFVFNNQADNGKSTVSETVAPTMPEEPTLTIDPTHTATEPPTEAPTVAADYGAMADAYMKDMSDREKMCQLFIVTPEVLTASLDDSDNNTAVTVAGDMTKKSLEEYPVGGLIYFGDNLVDQDQTKKMIDNSQSYSSTPLFIAVDEEGGDVARVASKLGTKKFEPMLTYKDKGEAVAHDNAEVIASNLRALGFNMDNAPVADVLSNPKNTVIGDRAYSDDYAQAAQLVGSAVKGFNDSGVICVLKHFPGHGGTDEDSHEGLAYVKATAEELKKNELQPFKSGIEAGANMVMVGHLVVSDLDPDLPATLSSKVVPELLRKELGYNGIVISDSMQMDALSSYDHETIVKGLFAADIDIILQPDDLDEYLDAMESLLASGEIKMEQIDAKVKKILTLKYQQGVIAPANNTAPAATEAPTAPAASEAPAPAAAPAAAVQTPSVPEQPTLAA